MPLYRFENTLRNDALAVEKYINLGGVRDEATS